MKWKFQTEGKVRAGPVVEPDGTIYAFSDALYALRPDGTQKWKLGTRGVEAYSRDLSPVVGEDGTIYITDGYLKAVNPDGSLKWQLKSTSVINAGAAIGSDGNIYTGGSCSLYGPPSDPEEAHKCSQHEEPHYFLYSVTPAGLVNWKLNVGKCEFNVCGIDQPPVVGPDGTVYAVNGGNGMLFAVHPSGSVKWTYSISKNDALLTSKPVLSADGTIYVSGADSADVLLSINAHGKEQWRSPVGRGRLYSSPVIGPDG